MSALRRMMLLSLLTIGLLVPVVTAQTYPHAFPRTGVTRLFENERVIAWDVKWLHDVPQPYHRHQYDMAGVYTVYGPIQVTGLDGTVAPITPFAVPRPYFQPKDITHKEEAMGLAGAPVREAVMLDLKEGTFAPVTRPGTAAAFPREGAAKAIDNARVTEWDYVWIPGRRVETRIYERDAVEVFFDGGTIRYRTPDGKEETRTFARKDARFIPRGTIRSEEAVAGAPRAVIVELK
jgi:hypothetical protein